MVGGMSRGTVWLLIIALCLAFWCGVAWLVAVLTG